MHLFLADLGQLVDVLENFGALKGRHRLRILGRLSRCQVLALVLSSGLPRLIFHDDRVVVGNYVEDL